MANIYNVISDVLEEVNLGNFQTEVQQNGEFYRIKFSKDNGQRFMFAEIMREDGYVISSLGRRRGICRPDCERIMNSLVDRYSSREPNELSTDTESSAGAGRSTD
jgi:hypothetical protein